MNSLRLPFFFRLGDWNSRESFLCATCKKKNHKVNRHTQKTTSVRQSARNIPYLLTPWCRVLLEKLTGLQLVKKFPAFYETRRFITALTSVRHLSLSCANPIQSIYPHPTSCRSILILSPETLVYETNKGIWTQL